MQTHSTVLIKQEATPSPTRTDSLCKEALPICRWKSTSRGPGSRSPGFRWVIFQRLLARTCSNICACYSALSFLMGIRNSGKYSVQSDVKQAIDAKAYPKVSADLRHQLGTLRYCHACQHFCKHIIIALVGCLADVCCKLTTPVLINSLLMPFCMLLPMNIWLERASRI